jgi:uncharacterized membrane protein YagU involved in acid resistance
MSFDIRRAALGGIAGTAVMTMVGLWVAPMMGIPRMNPATMLAGAMGGMLALGWLAHFMIGTVLAIGYAVIAPRLRGPAVFRGAVYAMAPWLMAQVLVMPMMGMPLFSGSFALAGGSLVGHLMYGATVGGIYGAPASPA